MLAPPRSRRSWQAAGGLPDAALDGEEPRRDATHRGGGDSRTEEERAAQSDARRQRRGGEPDARCREEARRDPAAPASRGRVRPPQLASGVLGSAAARARGRHAPPGGYAIGDAAAACRSAEGDAQEVSSSKAPSKRCVRVVEQEHTRQRVRTTSDRQAGRISPQ